MQLRFTRSAIVALAGTFTTAVEITSDTLLVPTDTTPTDFRTGTWMLDDLADNVDGARAVGWHGVVVGADRASAVAEVDAILG